jgi:hypothetical protein
MKSNINITVISPKVYYNKVIIAKVLLNKNGYNNYKVLKYYNNNFSHKNIKKISKGNLVI